MSKHSTLATFSEDETKETTHCAGFDPVGWADNMKLYRLQPAGVPRNNAHGRGDWKAGIACFKNVHSPVLRG